MRTIMFHPDRCMSCNGCLLACAIEHSNSRNLFHVIQNDATVVSRLRFTCKGTTLEMISCNHCEDHICIKSCPVGAITKDAHYGCVVIDDTKCVNCGLCSRMCPEKAIVLVSQKVYKCDGCLERRKIKLFPACLSACPTGAIRSSTEN